MYMTITNCIISHVDLLSKKVKESFAQLGVSIQKAFQLDIFWQDGSPGTSITVLLGGKSCAKATQSLLFPIQELQQQQLLMSV